MLGSGTMCRRPEFDPPSGLCPEGPAYSAGGARLAFGLDGRLAVAGPDGSGAARLPQLTDSDEDPAWSPEGDRLVFTGKRGKRRNLYVVGSDGTGIRRLIRTGGGLATWSSRGRIAYAARGIVYRLNRACHRVRVARGTSPDWSPSGRSIVYSRKGRVYTVSARRGARRKLVAKHGTDPIFSPDGRWAAFLRGDEITDSIYLVRLHGGKASRLAAGGELPIGSAFASFGALAWRPIP